MSEIYNPEPNHRLIIEALNQGDHQKALRLLPGHHPGFFQNRDPIHGIGATAELLVAVAIELPDYYQAMGGDAELESRRSTYALPFYTHFAYQSVEHLANRVANHLDSPACQSFLYLERYDKRTKFQEAMLANAEQFSGFATQTAFLDWLWAKLVTNSYMAPELAKPIANFPQLLSTTKTLDGESRLDRRREAFALLNIFFTPEQLGRSNRFNYAECAAMWPGADQLHTLQAWDPTKAPCPITHEIVSKLRTWLTVKFLRNWNVPAKICTSKPKAATIDPSQTTIDLGNSTGTIEGALIRDQLPGELRAIQVSEKTWLALGMIGDPKNTGTISALRKRGFEVLDTDFSNWANTAVMDPNPRWHRPEVESDGILAMLITATPTPLFITILPALHDALPGFNEKLRPALEHRLRNEESRLNVAIKYSPKKEDWRRHLKLVSQTLLAINSQVATETLQNLL